MGRDLAQIGGIHSNYTPTSMPLWSSVNLSSDRSLTQNPKLVSAALIQSVKETQLSNKFLFGLELEKGPPPPLSSDNKNTAYVNSLHICPDPQRC